MPLSMRITGGKYCGRKVIIPQGKLEIRPAMDRMRESLFSILGPLDNLNFLDLFSGSGCIALEAASRGADNIDLVEMDYLKKDIITKNISWALADGININLFFYDCFFFIENCNKKYSIIYADPPFPLKNKTEILLSCIKKDRLKRNGLFIIHIPTSEDSLWKNSYKNMVLSDRRKYGRNTLLFFSMI